MSLRKEWNEYLSLSVLPKEINAIFREEASFLHADLLEHKLRVILIPAPEPQHYDHKIRVVEIANPQWYSKLYNQFVHFRRDRSLRALERLADGEDKAFTDSRCGIVAYKFHYDTLYRKLIFERLTEGYEDYYGNILAGHVPANSMVREYFGLEEEIPF